MIDEEELYDVNDLIDEEEVGNEMMMMKTQ